jgi:hypothetical protein
MFKVELVLPVMLVLLSETDSPDGLVTLNVTVDAKPLRELRLMLEDPCAPVLSERLDGLAERLKSSKLSVMVVE